MPRQVSLVRKQWQEDVLCEEWHSVPSQCRPLLPSRWARNSNPNSNSNIWYMSQLIYILVLPFKYLIYFHLFFIMNFLTYCKPVYLNLYKFVNLNYFQRIPKKYRGKVCKWVKLRLNLIYSEFITSQNSRFLFILLIVLLFFFLAFPYKLFVISKLLLLFILPWIKTFEYFSEIRLYHIPMVILVDDFKIFRELLESYLLKTSISVRFLELL